MSNKFEFHVEAPQARVNRDLDAFDARIAKSIVGVEKLKAAMRDLGRDYSGITKFMAALTDLESRLARTNTTATDAGGKLKGLGTGNRGLAGYTKRLDDLLDRLNRVPGAAGGAQGALGGVGVGGGGRAAGGGGGGGGAAGGLIGGVVGGLAAAGARKVLHAAGESGRAQREFFADAADRSALFREEMRELGNLQHKPVDNALLREQLAFQKETGLDEGEARALRLEFEGAAESGIKKGNITQKTADALEKQAGKFALRYDLDPGMTGRMAGLLGEYGKVPSAAAGAGVLASSAEALNLYGVGSVKSMMAPMFAMAGEMLDEDGGRFTDIPKMSMRFAATTIRSRSPAMAATRIRQANRLMRRFSDEKEGKALREMGLTPEMDFEEAIHKIAPFITGPDGDLFLAEKGFGNSTERAAVIAQAKLNATVDEQMKDKRIAMAGVNAVRDNDAFLRTPIGQSRAASNNFFASEIEQGMRGERLRTGRTSARARMANPNQPGGQQLKAGFAQGILDMSNSAWAGFSQSGEDIRVDTEAIRGLIRGGERVGVDIRKEYPFLGYAMDKTVPLDPNYLRKAYAEASDKVEKAGGDPFGGDPQQVGAKIQQAAALLNQAGQAVQQMKGQRGNAGPGFVPGRK